MRRELARSMFHLAAAERQGRAEQLLEMVGLRPEYINRYPHAFSGGQRQRIGIARAIVADPKVVVADEPTGALDTRTGTEVMELLLELHESRALTLIIVTHDPEVAEVSRRNLMFRDGEIIDDLLVGNGAAA